MSLLQAAPLLRFFCCLLLMLAGCEEQAPATLHLDISCVQVGDILFRRGSSFVSRGVLRVDTDSHYSHVGLAVKVDGRIMVAHAVPDEESHELTKIEPLETFYAPDVAQAGAICRLPLDDAQRELINKRAQELVAARLPFDHDYDTQNHDKLYCTEFIWLVYQDLAIDVSGGKRQQVEFAFISANLILPSHLYKAPQARVVTRF